MQFVLSEAGSEIGRFDSIAEAKAELQKTWGEDQPLEWVRKETPTRHLAYEQFTIHAEDSLGRLPRKEVMA